MSQYQRINLVNYEGIQKAKSLLSNKFTVHDYKIVAIDRHEAIKTDAYTRWILPNDAIFLFRIGGLKKTHWQEYYLVHKNSVLKRIRRSNRGNIEIKEYIAKDMHICAEELKIALTLIFEK
jgi:hypothetical protein